MQQTLVILKPSAMQRALAGKVIDRFQQKGLQIVALKMIRFDEALCRKHYSHLTDKPFFPEIVASMTACPVLVMVLQGTDAISVVRLMTGPTNGREAAPGTIRGDYAMSNQENIIHASSSEEDAAAEVARFFTPDEIFEYQPVALGFTYGPSLR